MQDTTKPLGINWIGLGTIVRREVSRMMRVPIQAFVAPWISALLFIFIFGFIVGGRMPMIGGHKYIQFVLPGVLMLNIVNASFLQSSSAIYFSRFLRFIEETLVSPMSYVEMIAGSLAVVVVRSTVTAIGILVIGIAFGATKIYSIPEFLFWVVAVSAIFGLLGIVIGLWAKSFEQLNMLTVFFITPLSMVGGVFNTIAMLPPWMRWMAYGNPFFYFINGIRHSMLGYSEVSQTLGYGLTITALVVMFLWVLRLYAKGYGLRE
ncbi:MAG TPA: ABC transporter permease [Rhizomicrobium sp.]|jgi:ABC-2 type transport system permease protein|nr:ABC transporter permease [Rhizomicrobium sp.]